MRPSRANSCDYFCRESDTTGAIDGTLKFTTTEECTGKMVTIDLKLGGADIAVTEGNKEEYVDLMVEYRISKRVKDQFNAFMSGFSELIPHDLITVFSERELEFLVSGISDIDVYALSFFSFLYLRLEG
jgi:E3 ubiquitin-protein ligase NEDD4